MLASIKKCYSILFYHLKKSLYYLYHTILQYLASQNSIFIKILFFNLSLLFLSNRHFFFSDFGMFQFLGFPTVFFFPLSPSILSTGSTHRATHTDPWYTDQPIQTHHHTHRATHTHTHKHKPSTLPHTQAIDQQQWPTHRSPHPPPKPLISKPKPPIGNPRCRFETHRSKPIQKKSSPEPPSELPMVNPTNPPTDQQIHCFKPTINRSQPITHFSHNPNTKPNHDPQPF